MRRLPPAWFGQISRVAASRLVVPVLAVLAPTPAWAHGSLSIGEFYTGMFHPLFHFDTLLPTLAVALWSGQLGGLYAWRLPLVFLAAALLGAVAGIWELELGLGGPLIRISILVLGLLVATRGKLPVVVALALVFLFGVSQGQANTYNPEVEYERPLLFLAGLLSSIGLILFHIVTRVARYRAFWVQTAVRVVGSWIAATGLLVLVLEWSGQA